MIKIRSLPDSWSHNSQQCDCCGNLATVVISDSSFLFVGGGIVGGGNLCLCDEHVRDLFGKVSDYIHTILGE